MRRLAWLLIAALLCAPPGRAWADSHDAFHPHQQASSCIIQVSDDDGPRHRHLQCLAGVAVKVYSTGMNVRAPHAPLRKLRFTDMTLFETDSGEGVLDGLMSGDYVCVGYTSHSSTLTALVVLFDPMSSPCSPRRQESSWAPGQVSPDVSPAGS